METVVIYTILVVAAVLATLGGIAEAKSPSAMFVFGDSLVDAGNNNYLTTLAKANSKPYGVDFPAQKPTGRFCNGRLIADFVSEYFGMEPTLPYLDPNLAGQNLLLGANFASAGAGILDDTGSIFISRITTSQQLEYFSLYQQDLQQVIGVAPAENLISEALYSVTIGGNDYVNNYLRRRSRRSSQFTLSQFQDLLISTFRSQLQQLYKLGARKVAVTNLGPIGCIPSQLAQKSSPSGGQCIEQLQELAMNYNTALKLMLEELTQELTGSTFLYTDAFQMTLDIINNPATYGFQYSDKACCGQGPYNGSGTCTPFSPFCQNRSIYVFWDAFHPTEAVNKLISERVLHGPQSDISPINLSQLFAD